MAFICAIPSPPQSKFAQSAGLTPTRSTTVTPPPGLLQTRCKPSGLNWGLPYARAASKVEDENHQGLRAVLFHEGRWRRG